MYKQIAVKLKTKQRILYKDAVIALTPGNDVHVSGYVLNRDKPGGLQTSNGMTFDRHPLGTIYSVTILF